MWRCENSAHVLQATNATILCLFGLSELLYQQWVQRMSVLPPVALPFYAAAERIVRPGCIDDALSGTLSDRID